VVDAEAEAAEALVAAEAPVPAPGVKAHLAPHALAARRLDLRRLQHLHRHRRRRSIYALRVSI
jgi:hypothetical protein